jgi:DNA-binding transcriptional regulator YiaG
MMHKTTFKALREDTPFSRAALARYARLSEDTIKKLEERKPVSRDSAEKALAALNTILHTAYILEDVDVALTAEAHK